MTVRAAFSLAFGALWVLCAANEVHAQSGAAGLVEGIARYERGDLEGSLAAFEDAERGEGLDRDSLVRLLTTRALVHFALGTADAMEHDLLALLSLAPDIDMGRRAPPDVLGALERLRGEGGALSLELTVEAEPLGLAVVARVHGDRAGLVQRVELGARSEGPWQQGGARVSVPGAERVLAYARAIGPGGAVLAVVGSQDAPVSLTGTASVGVDDQPDDSLAIGLGVGAGVLALGVLAVILGVVLGSASGQRALGAPQVEWSVSSALTFPLGSP